MSINDNDFDTAMLMTYQLIFREGVLNDGVIVRMVCSGTGSWSQIAHAMFHSS